MQPTQPYNNVGIRHYFRLAIIVFIILILFCIGLFTYRTLSFRIVKTEPKTSYVAASSAYMKIYFNKPVSNKGLKIKSSPNFISSYKTSGNVITLHITTSGLKTNQNYQLNLQHIASMSGKSIDNKIINFIAKNVDFNKTSKAQQKASIDQQDKYPYMVTTVPFDGFDALVNNGGLSSDQNQTVKQAIFDYSNKVGVKFAVVSLINGSVAPQPYNPDTDDSRVTTFSFAVNQTVYNTVVNYSDLDDASVVIKDQAGATVFDTSVDSNNDDE